MTIGQKPRVVYHLSSYLSKQDAIKGNLLGFETSLRRRGKNLLTLPCMISDGYLQKTNIHSISSSFQP